MAWPRATAPQLCWASLGRVPGASVSLPWKSRPCSVSPLGSCRSAVMEARAFWRFEGAMIGVAVIFALLVVCRQRVLDRKALEKVRKQIESI